MGGEPADRPVPGHDDRSGGTVQDLRRWIALTIVAGSAAAVITAQPAGPRGDVGPASDADTATTTVVATTGRTSGVVEERAPAGS